DVEFETVSTTSNSVHMEPVSNAPRLRWQITIDGYETQLVRFESPALEFLSVDATAPEPVLQTLRTQIGQLAVVLANERDPTLRVEHANIDGDFERWDPVPFDAASENPNSPPRLATWNTSQLPGVRFEPSPDFPHSGRLSLKITNTNTGDASAWLQSQSIPVPNTGRLSVEAWLRVPASAPSARVRLSVQGTTRSGKRFSASSICGSATDRTQQLPTDWGPRPYSLHVADIPTTEMNSLIVSIELIGEGTVWVDDVRVLQSWLHPSESSFLRGKMLAAEEDLTGENYLTASRLLDSPWVQYLRRKHPLFESQSTTTQSLNQFADHEESQVDSDSAPSILSGGSVWGRSNDRPPKSSLIEQLKESVTEGWQR
ncbi:MAG: hypothetical protein AAGG44_10575, partial [Planctomycetota bacterium]